MCNIKNNIERQSRPPKIAKSKEKENGNGLLHITFTKPQYSSDVLLQLDEPLISQTEQWFQE